MALDLVDYETMAREAVQAFWGNRAQARKKQIEAGRVDTGERGAVTAGKNMDGFIALVIAIVRANGLAGAKIHRSRPVLTIPGYFRPTKLWDLLVLHEGRLVAALECKSQVGPSFGNNFNNRAEEAIGTAHDFQMAYREGAFGQSARPFTGWLILVEDAPGSRAPVSDTSQHFPVFPAFQGASYQQRYHLLCQRLVREQLYTAACALASPRTAAIDGQYADLGEITGLRTFVAALAGHVAAEATRGAA
jgi:hypothetical protein